MCLANARKQSGADSTSQASYRKARPSPLASLSDVLYSTVVGGCHVVLVLRVFRNNPGPQPNLVESTSSPGALPWAISRDRLSHGVLESVPLLPHPSERQLAAVGSDHTYVAPPSRQGKARHGEAWHGIARSTSHAAKVLGIVSPSRHNQQARPATLQIRH